MKRLDWFPWLLVFVLLGAGYGYRLAIRDARAESARLRATLDSLAGVQARVDTVTVVRKQTLTRIETHRDTLRQTLTVTDTVEVLRFIAVQDSVILACHAVIESCEDGKRVRDARIAALDSLNASTERMLTTERAAQRRKGLCAVGGAVGGGALGGSSGTAQNAALGAGLGALAGVIACR